MNTSSEGPNRSGVPSAYVIAVAMLFGFLYGIGRSSSWAGAAHASGLNQQCEPLAPMGVLPPPGEPGFVADCSRTYALIQGQGGGTNGNWQTLSFPECNEGPCAGLPSSGANTLRCLLEHGYGCCIGIDSILQTEPGQSSAAIIQGLQGRWDADTDGRPDICHSEYVGNGQRIVHSPVIQSLGAGRAAVRVVGLAAFFLKNRPAGGAVQMVVAEFIRDIVPGPSEAR